MTNYGATADHAVLATEPPAGVVLGRAGTSLEERGPASARPGHAPDGRRGPCRQSRGPTPDFGPAFRVRRSARVCLVPGENSGAAAPSSANASAPVAGPAPKPNLADAASATDRQPSRLKAFRNTLTELHYSARKKAFPTKPRKTAQLRARALPQDWGGFGKIWPYGSDSRTEMDAPGVAPRLPSPARPRLWRRRRGPRNRRPPPLARRAGRLTDVVKIDNIGYGP